MGYFIYIIAGLTGAVYMVLIWGSVSYLVTKEQVTVAYGVLTCMGNFTNAVLPPLLSAIYEATKDKYKFKFVIITLFVTSFLCLIMKIWLLLWDYKVRGGVLQAIDVG